MKHTLLIAAAFALFSFASCNNTTTENKSATTDSTAIKAASKAERNKKMIMEGMAAFNAHDTGRLLKTMTADFVEYQDGTMPPVKGDSAKHALADYLNAFPDMKSENSMYFADGNNVVVVSDWTLTFKNDMGPMKATGKSAKFKDVDIFTLDDNGKVTSHRSIYPSGAVMMQVGVDMAKMMEKDSKKK